VRRFSTSSSRGCWCRCCCRGPLELCGLWLMVV
jgi:hypothetical protein